MGNIIEKIGFYIQRALIMDFIFKRSFDNSAKIEVCYCNKLTEITIQENKLYVERLLHLDYVELRNNSNLQIAIGDVIQCGIDSNDIKKYKGLHYLCTIIDGIILRVESDFHSLLPLYYAKDDNSCYVSSSFLILANLLSTKTVNPNFFIDTAILYSNIGEDTYYKEIKRVQYGDRILVDSTLEVKNTKRFYNYFVDNPVPVNKSLVPMADLLIELSRYYLKEPCAVTLTGGFDTRVNIGCAHYYNTDFISCSFGKIGNGDVENPLHLAKKLDFNYHLIELDSEYIQNNFFSSAIESMILTGGLSGFHSPQTLYYAKTIGGLRDILITGYLGSELFANAKEGNDEVVSQTVIDYLKHDKNNYAYSVMPLLVDLEIITDKNDIDDSLNRLERYFTGLPGYISRNQQISTYNFENTFRNTFGQWIYLGMHYLKIRTPFIDKDFFDTLSKTRLSAFYREFLEKNPYRRMDGQKLYPQILSRTWPELNNMTSSKGYSPYEVMSLHGQIMLAAKLFWTKKIIKQQQREIVGDNRAREEGVKYYMKNIESLYGGHYKSKLLKHINNNSLITKMFCIRSLTNKEFERFLRHENSCVN